MESIGVFRDTDDSNFVAQVYFAYFHTVFLKEGEVPTMRLFRDVKNLLLFFQVKIFIELPTQVEIRSNEI